jgi:leucyl aminopeptidase (aminopeptidase T)
MLACDIVFSVNEVISIVHTNAGTRAREKGIKFVVAGAGYREDFYDRDISVDDLNSIKERTERIAEIMSRSNAARVTSSYGTDLRMSLKGRKGIAIHPLSGAAITTVPDYAEVAVSPVEGLTEGILVTEGGIRRWDLPLREPLRLFVKSGKVTEVSGPEDYVERVKELLATDENASNCAAELGIGTSHNSPRHSRGGLGTVHIAVGRNNDIGGNTFSQIHYDLLIYYPTLLLDNLCLIKDGKFKG